MITGFEALGAASAVLQVISFASDLAVTCKGAYDGATTSHDDLERHSKRMFEAVHRVYSRCEQMAAATSRFADPNLQTIFQDCKDAATKLQAEVQYVTKIQAKDNIFKSLRKALRTSWHRKTIQAVEESLSRYQELIGIELTSHLCSQSDAIQLQQEQSFHKMDNDIQFLVNQLAQGVTEAFDFVKTEHVTTRAVVTQETVRAEKAINTHTDTQIFDLKATNEANQQHRAFLQSLKGERMNQRYNDILDPRDATFIQLFASYQDVVAMYYRDSEIDHSEHDQASVGDYSEYNSSSEDDDNLKESDNPHNDQKSQNDNDEDPDDDQSSGSSSDVSCASYASGIWASWGSFISWLQSDETLFYIQGKPGSGKSTLVKFILDHDRTLDFIQQWNPDATIIRYFFWKIGSHEQNSIKGLWCSLLYQGLQGRPGLIPKVLEQFPKLSLHTSYHDWTITDLQAMWEFTINLDN